MSLRKAWVLAERLPAGALLWGELGVDSAWTEETHVLASVVDLLAQGNWQRAEGKGSAPKPVDRPADIYKAERRRGRAAEKAERFRARQEMKKALPPAHRPPTEPH